MSNISNIIERIMNWLNTGISAEIFIKKALVIAATILIIYRLGYGIGKLLFHIGL